MKPLLNKRFFQSTLSCLVFSLAWTSHALRSNAVIIGRETPDTLSLSFSRSDSSPTGNSRFSDGPVVTLFDGEYWQISAQSLAAPTGPAAGRSQLFVQQVISGQSVLPRAVFGLSLRDIFPTTQQVSYLASSPETSVASASVTCPLASSDCVFYTLQPFLSTPNSPFPFPDSYELQGFFQPPESPPTVPEPSTDIGAFIALGLIAVLRINQVKHKKQ
jgi:hypothetical protein